MGDLYPRVKDKRGKMSIRFPQKDIKPSGLSREARVMDCIIIIWLVKGIIITDTKKTGVG